MTENSANEGDTISNGREPVQIRMSMSREWVETELMPTYSAVTSASQAARIACMEGVEAREGEGGMVAEINGAIIQALRESGGTVENCQTIHIGPDGDVVVEERTDTDAGEE